MTKYMISQIGEMRQLDITEPMHGVEVIIKDDRSVLWVNVDGVCCLRVCRIPVLIRTATIAVK